MPELILFDGPQRDHLLPLTFSRPVADLRVGILTIREKWEKRLTVSASFLTQDYLTAKFPLCGGDDNLVVDGGLLPDDELVNRIRALAMNEVLVSSDRSQVIAARIDQNGLAQWRHTGALSDYPNMVKHATEARRIGQIEDLFTHNFGEIRHDFQLLTQGRQSAALSSSNTLIGPPENCFLEPSASVEAAVINCEDGPIYFGAGCKVLEGCLLRAPLAVGEGALLKMGAKIYGGTTIGPRCKAGGEINNAILHANSNKGHDGYLGNSFIGEWCNLGADTNASNLRNDYGEVRVWSYAEQGFRRTGRQFFGLVMGDHSKCGINTMFNTGTIVGFSCNVFGEGFPRPFIPSFSWGGAAGLELYRLDKAMATAERVMARRKVDFTEADRAIFEYVQSVRPGKA